MSNPLVDAIPATGPVARTVTRQNLAEALALPLKDAAAVAAFNTWNLATDGTLYEAVIYAGSVYDYDSADTTTAHDPAGGCIVSGDGRRYKRSLNIKPDHIVLDKDLTAPPGSPSEGDAYYVATGATGAWAGQDKNYALYGGRGWTFRDVSEGHILYVSDEASFYHMPAGGTLTKGLGDLALANASIELKHLESPAGTFVEAEQNTPPGSPTDRIKYIVGTSPTDDWVGQAGKIAEYDSAIPGWVFHSPLAGWFVNDKGAGYLKKYTGSAWARAVAASPILQIARAKAASTATVSPGSWNTVLTFASVAAADTSNFFSVRGTGFTHQNGDVTKWGLFVDTESSARVEFDNSLDSFELWFNPSDLNAHDIHIKAFNADGFANAQVASTATAVLSEATS